MSNRCTPSHIFSLPTLPAGFAALAYALLRDGSLAILADDQQIASSYYDPHLHPDLWERTRAARARLWTYKGGALHFHFEFDLETTWPIVSRFPDGRWLVVASRTGEHANARIFDNQGTLLRRFMLGDAIEALKIDARGFIWVGWFDEGIDQAWVVPGQDGSPSSTGLACFDDTGALVWQPNGTGYMECEALNLSNDYAWLLPYPDERLYRFSRTSSTEAWEINLASSANALAVNERHVVLAGRPELNLKLARLDATSAELIADGVLDAPPMTRSAASLLDGEGAKLHLIGGGEWRQWDVADMVRQFTG